MGYYNIINSSINSIKQQKTLIFLSYNTKRSRLKISQRFKKGTISNYIKILFYIYVIFVKHDKISAKIYKDF